MNKDELLYRAQNIVAGRRQRAITAAHAQETAVRAQLPALDALQSQKTQAGILAARLAAAGAPRADVDAALARVAILDCERTALLAQMNLAPDALAPRFTCQRCNDTGRVNGTVCTCVLELVRKLRLDQINASSPLSLCTFDSFDLMRYPDTQMPELGISARAQMAGILDYCRAYAEDFSLNSTSLYMCGYAGLGKTHLALSIASVALGKGFDVVYISAQNAFDAIEKERFNGGGNTMETLLEAQLLILDDLGTEFVSPYVSSCLYSLINTRVNSRRATIYTSNIISDRDLRRRYTEKIVSRLLGSCETLCFCGQDIRLQNK